MNVGQLKERLASVPDQANIVASDGHYWHMVESAEVWETTLILHTGRVAALVLNEQTVMVHRGRTPGVV